MLIRHTLPLVVCKNFNYKQRSSNCKQKAPKHNCKQRSSIVSRKLPTVSKKAAQNEKENSHTLFWLQSSMREALSFSRISPWSNVLWRLKSLKGSGQRQVISQGSIPLKTWWLVSIETMLHMIVTSSDGYVVSFRLISSEKLYTPPPSPHFWPKGILQGRGVGVYILRPHAAGILYPPPFIHPPPLGGYFQGWGGGGA